MRTMPGEREGCKNCLHCSAIFTDEENRPWTVCDLKACIHQPRIKKEVQE